MQTMQQENMFCSKIGLLCSTDLYILTGNDTISCSRVWNPCWKGEKYSLIKSILSLHCYFRRHYSYCSLYFFSPYSSSTCVIYDIVNLSSLIPFHMYFGFEFLLQPVNLSENLENVLLSMCEESSQLRISLTKVLEVSYYFYRSINYFNRQFALFMFTWCFALYLYARSPGPDSFSKNYFYQDFCLCT